TYKKAFLGTDAVDYLVTQGIVTTTEEAVTVGNLMMEAGAFHHVTDERAFKNAPLYYRFAADEPSHGKKRVDDTGAAVSWASLGAALWPGGSPDSAGTGGAGGTGASANLQSAAGAARRDADLQLSVLAEEIGVSPLDAFNVDLLDNVHPAAWQDPPGDGVYNLVVLGAGSGGLVTAAGAAGVGARVALIESHLLGGDCLNVGCVPSKALIRAASVAHTVRNAAAFGVSVGGEVKVDFGKVMERLRRLRAGISHHDSAQRFAEELGVDVFIGCGTFTGRNTISVNGKTLTFKKAVVATGGTPALPPVPGLKEAPYLTNQSIFNLTELPPRLVVVGGGPIGLELAQAMRRFGSDVTVLVRSQLLPKEDPDAAAVLRAALEADGVKIVEHVAMKAITHQLATAGFPTIRVAVTAEGEEVVYECEALLVATGRKPNVAGLGLEAAGVEFDDSKGVAISDTLQTTNASIYAVGDCCTPYQVT
ncbi:unnamed protein product, partial [Phaeothamnion confervicola]